jgi:hypothetical protein
MFTALALGIAATAAPAPANVEISGSQLVKTVQNCQSIRDNGARLACYDRSVATLTAADARGDVTVMDREQMRQAHRSLFGFSLPNLPFFSGSKDKEVQQEPKQLASTLASFRDIGNGFFRFTIADPASTWESTEASNVFDPKIGAKVIIERGAIGSYFAEIGGNRAVRARRIR